MKFLGDPRPVVRKNAIEKLAKRGNGASKALAAFLNQSNSPEARRNAVWALTQIDSTEARAAVRPALKDKDNTVRHVATHSISAWRDEKALHELLPLLQDEDPQVQRSTAEALGRIGSPEAVGPLLNAAARLGNNSRILEHSLIFALIEIADREAPARGLSSENSRVHRAALIALDQMPKGQLAPSAVTPLLLSADPVLRETANWIVSRHADWGGALVGFFQERLSVGSLPTSEAVDLQTQLVPLAKAPAIQDLLASTLASVAAPKWSRLVALQAMAQANVKPAPSNWVQGVATTLQSSDSEFVRASVATARNLALLKTVSPDLDRALFQIGDNPNNTPETRLEALAAAGKLDRLSAGVFDFVIGNVAPEKPWAIRNNAAVVLSKARLDRSQLLILADTLRGVGPLELSKLINPFGASVDAMVGSKLVENLKAAKAITSLRVEILQATLSHYPESVQREATGLYTLRAADAGKQKEHLDQLQAQSPKGDVRRGQVVFNSPKASCSTCHAIGYLGGHLGPDLTTVGTIRTERDLLESIVYPSASFVRSYEPMTVVTTVGDDYSGVVRRDSPAEVILATGPETEVRVARADIVEMRHGKVSIMPQGLEEQLSKQELADLVTFLKNTRWGAK